MPRRDPANSVSPRVSCLSSIASFFFLTKPSIASWLLCVRRGPCRSLPCSVAHRRSCVLWFSLGLLSSVGRSLRRPCLFIISDWSCCLLDYRTVYILRHIPAVPASGPHLPMRYFSWRHCRRKNQVHPWRTPDSVRPWFRCSAPGAEDPLWRAMALAIPCLARTSLQIAGPASNLASARHGLADEVLEIDSRLQKMIR